MSAPLMPLTVWTTTVPGRAGCLPAAVAARAIATFSKPHDLVVTIGGPAYLDAARYLHRRHRTAHRTATPPPSRRPGEFTGGAAALVIDHPATGSAADLLDGFADVVRLLRPGGFLLTVHAPTGGAVDPLAATIAAARATGLRYLQHLVALTAHITASGLPAPPADPSDRLLAPAHTDLAVFTLPGGGHA
jgi:hypothetical protein